MTWRFAPSAPISTYIYAVCAGPYEVVSDVYTSAKGTTMQRRRRHFTDNLPVLALRGLGITLAL